jgi:hypothetical protein
MRVLLDTHASAFSPCLTPCGIQPVMYTAHPRCLWPQIPFDLPGQGWLNMPQNHVQPVERIRRLRQK